MSRSAQPEQMLYTAGQKERDVTHKLFAITSYKNAQAIHVYFVRCASDEAAYVWAIRVRVAMCLLFVRNSASKSGNPTNPYT